MQLIHLPLSGMPPAQGEAPVDTPVAQGDFAGSFGAFLLQTGEAGQGIPPASPIAVKGAALPARVIPAARLPEISVPAVGENDDARTADVALKPMVKVGDEDEPPEDIVSLDRLAVPDVSAQPQVVPGSCLPAIETQAEVVAGKSVGEIIKTENPNVSAPNPFSDPAQVQPHPLTWIAPTDAPLLRIRPIPDSDVTQDVAAPKPLKGASSPASAQKRPQSVPPIDPVNPDATRSAGRQVISAPQETQPTARPENRPVPMQTTPPDTALRVSEAAMASAPHDPIDVSRQAIERPMPAMTHLQTDKARPSVPQSAPLQAVTARPQTPTAALAPGSGAPQFQGVSQSVPTDGNLAEIPQQDDAPRLPEIAPKQL
ncbi:hypothetical protein, partial [Actibacterium sp.]|uniref:hypothetical protein n=1 Tax=Actibacterium sp. TaxID=1872125 RepID=UPI00356362B4